MPTETPLGTDVRVTPSDSANDRPCDPQLGVEHRHLEGRLRHAVADDVVQRGQDRLGRHRSPRRLPLEQPWDEVPLEHVTGAVEVLGRVHGVRERHALAPPDHLARIVLGGDLDEQWGALGLGGERGGERADEGQPDGDELDADEMQLRWSFRGGSGLGDRSR